MINRRFLNPEDGAGFEANDPYRFIVTPIKPNCVICVLYLPANETISACGVADSPSRVVRIAVPYTITKVSVAAGAVVNAVTVNVPVAPV